MSRHGPADTWGRIPGLGERTAPWRPNPRHYPAKGYDRARLEEISARARVRVAAREAQLTAEQETAARRALMDGPALVHELDAEAIAEYEQIIEEQNT